MSSTRPFNLRKDNLHVITIRKSSSAPDASDGKDTIIGAAAGAASLRRPEAPSSQLAMNSLCYPSG